MIKVSIIKERLCSIVECNRFLFIFKVKTLIFNTLANTEI